MKKILFYILIITSLSILIFFGTQKNNRTTTLIDKRDFSISDTLSINKIVLENRNLEKITLHRNSKHSNWILNDTLIANPYLISLLLKTIKTMRVKHPIARSGLENVIRRMDIQNTKVEFFQKNEAIKWYEFWKEKKKIKTIYVGGETADQLGTFMWIEGAKEPYVVHIPGFSGYLSSRFSCKEHLWRDKQIFNQQISSVKYFQPDLSDDNQKMIHHTSTINSKQTNPTIFTEVDSIYLKNIYCEKFIVQNEDLKNNIKNRTPFMIIEITTNFNKTLQFYCFRKNKVNKPKYENQKYDQERFYGLMNNTLMLIQYKQFENLAIYEGFSVQFMPWQETNNLIK